MPYLHPDQPLTLATLGALLASDEPVRLAPAAGAAPASAPPTALPTPEAPAAGLLLAYAVGTGPELPAALVRRLLLLQAYHLGQSPRAEAPALARRLLDFFSRDVWPVVPAQGALGAASSHIPLAHLGLPLLGLGEVSYQGYRLAAADVLGLFGWEVPAVPASAGPWLLGGAAYSLAYATEALARAAHLLPAADTLAALAAEAAAPAALGPPAASSGGVPAAVRAALAGAQQAVEAVINGPTAADLALPEVAELLLLLLPSAAAGAAEAPWLAQLPLGVAEVGRLSAQRTAHLVASSPPLPRYLAAGSAPGPGLRALPLAAASLVAHTQRLLAPAAGTPPGGPEVLQALENTELLLGLELLAATQALDLQPGAASGGPARAVVAAFRAHVTFVAAARPLAPDLIRAARFVREYAWA